MTSGVCEPVSSRPNRTIAHGRHINLRAAHRTPESSSLCPCALPLSNMTPFSRGPRSGLGPWGAR